MKRDYVKYAEEELKKRWFKLTPQREKVAEYIAGHKGMFSAEEVRRKTKGVNRSSIYRTLRLFSELDLIHPVLVLDEREYYEAHGVHHHHHEICTRCEKTACIPCPLPKAKSKILKVGHHTFAVTGICKSCL